MPLEKVYENSEKDIDIKEEKENKIEKINKEIEKVNKLIDISDKKLKEIKKDIYLTYDDIMGKDNLSNFIAVKSNDGTGPDIKILNEDDLLNNNLVANDFEENFISNLNKSLTMKYNPINNYVNNDVNPIFYENNTNVNKDIIHINNNNENREIMNINNRSSNMLQSQNPIELFLISAENQSSMVNYINNYNCFNNECNPFINKNNGEFFLNKNIRKDSDFSFVNRIPYYQG